MNGDASNATLRKSFSDFRAGFVFIIILLFQLSGIIYCGTIKADFHIDEIYSYILSNSYDSPKVSWAGDYYDQWISGESFKEFVSVQNGEQFTFDTVYKNNALDAHPPLYYYCLHFLCSLFPNTFSLWFGEILNILCFIGTQCLLFFICKRLLGNSIWATVPAALYGATMLCLDTVVFIRMYALLTFLTVLLADQHMRTLSKPKYLNYILCGVITFLGVYTQYYFAFVAFFMAAAFCLYLLIKRDWKAFMIYAASMLVAVILVFLLYPAAISQITGSSTNNIGNGIAAHFFDFSNFGAAVDKLWSKFRKEINPFIAQHKMKFLISALAFGIASVIFAKKPWTLSVKLSDRTKKQLSLVLVTVAILLLTFCTVTHISNQFLYTRYLYNIVPLMAVCVALIIYIIADSLCLNKNILVVGVLLTALIGTGALFINKTGTYLYTDASQVIVEESCEKPLIMLTTERNSRFPVANLDKLMESSTVYMTTEDNIAQIDTILDQVDHADGVVVMICTDTYWGTGLSPKIIDEIVQNSSILNTSAKLASCEFGEAYIIYP